MTEETKLTGDELEDALDRHDIDGSDMTADEKRAAVASAEGNQRTGDDSDDPVRTQGDEGRAKRIREILENDPVEEGITGATPEQNAELEHTMGGPTTRDDLTDQGVPMLQGSPDEPVGPEDAGGRGEKRGDYESRVLPSLGAHEAVRIDGTSGAEGPLIRNEDGGIDRAPHTRLEPQAPRFTDQGDEEGVKGGVETDPNHP